MGEGDRFCPVCGRPVVPPGVDEIVLASEARTEPPAPAPPEAPRAAIAATVVLVLAVVAVWALVFGGEPGEERSGGVADVPADTDDEPVPAPEPVPPTPTAEDETEELAQAADEERPTEVNLSLLADTGATHLAVRDDVGLRWVDLRSGNVTEAVDAASVIRPIEPVSGAVLIFDEVEQQIIAAAPSGTLWSVAATGHQVLRTQTNGYWQIGSAGPFVLTRHQGQQPEPVETVVLPVGGQVIGFHDGRPVTHVHGVIAIEPESGDTERVATGIPMAQNGKWLVYRPCEVNAACEAAPMRLDLETGERTVVPVGLSLAKFGHWGNSLSPDGRWMVAIDYSVLASGNRIVLVELDSGRRIGIPTGLLGFGGRTGSFEWSPNSAVLAAPGSNRLMLFDVGTEAMILLPLRVLGDVPSLAWVSVPGSTP